MDKRIRGFQVVKKYENSAIELPKRATQHSAGYDIQAAETVILPSFWKDLIRLLMKEMKQWIFASADKSEESEEKTLQDLFQPTLIPTGLKAYMQEDEYLQIISRSSNPIKRRITLPNSVGIIDQDYYNNENNEGHIYVQMINFGVFDQKIEKGERIAQGIFTKFLKVDDDTGGEGKRTGGFGSSDKQ